VHESLRIRVGGAGLAVDEAEQPLAGRAEEVIAAVEGGLVQRGHVGGTLQRSLDSLADADISVAALSADDEATTADLIARHGLRLPVGHSADAAAIARATGAFVNPGPPYLQSTGFVLDPGGRVIVSVYSSGAIGRLVPQDIIGLAGYLREHAQAS
jgi:hypothetical protein